MNSKEAYDAIVCTDKKWKDVIDFIASKQKEDDDAIKVLSIIGAKEPINRLNENAGITLFGKLTFELSPFTISDNNGITAKQWALHYPVALHGIDCDYEAQSKEFGRLREKVYMYAADFFNVSCDDFVAAFEEYKRIMLQSAKIM